MLLKKHWDKSDLFTVVVNVTDEMVGFLGSIIVEANKRCYYSKVRMALNCEVHSCDDVSSVSPSPATDGSVSPA